MPSQPFSTSGMERRSKTCPIPRDLRVVQPERSRFAGEADRKRIPGRTFLVGEVGRPPGYSAASRRLSMLGTKKKGGCGRVGADMIPRVFDLDSGGWMHGYWRIDEDRLWDWVRESGML